MSYSADISSAKFNALPPEFQDVFHLISHRRMLASLDIIAVTIYLWDLSLTFHLDVEHVWATKLNLIKVIYIIQRYLPILSTGWALLYEELAYDVDPQTCHVVSQFGGFAIMTGYLAGEFILTLRTWCAWDRHKHIGTALGTAFVLIATGNYIAMFFYQKSFIFERRPHPVVTGCVIDVTWRGTRIIWGSFLGWNTLLLLLILAPTIRSAQIKGKTLLSSAVYLEGTVYYFLTFAISLISLSLDTILPTSYIPLFRGMQPCLYSLFTSKAILAIWKTRDVNPNISLLCMDLSDSINEPTISQPIEGQEQAQPAKQEIDSHC